MKIRFEHRLLYVEAVLRYRGREIHLREVVLDTRSGGSVFSADRLQPLGIAPEPRDPLLRIRGVGGIDLVYSKTVEELRVGLLQAEDLEIQVGALDYGFPANGVLGLDFLLRVGAVVDLERLELRDKRSLRVDAL